jgi:AcrR family transcriptional regulator
VAVATRTRSEARQRFRDSVLDAALALAVRDGWGAVRMGQVADAVGVTRQTLHNEFGTKEGLGQALVLREADRFLLDVGARLARHPDNLRAAIADGAATALDLLSRDPLLRAALAGQDDRLLPLLTTRGQPVLQAVTSLVLHLVADRLPAGVDADALVGDMVRLVISHAVTPTEPHEVVGQRIARLFTAAVLEPA